MKKKVNKKKVTKKRAAKKPAHPLKLVNSHSWDKNAVMAIVCTEVATCSLGLHTILANGHKGSTLPALSTLMKWLNEDDELSQFYARAKEMQADFMAEEMLDICDDARNDYMEVMDKTGECIGYKTNGEAIQRTKLRIETRQWLMGKLRPRKYGTIKVDVDTPEDGTLAELQRELIDRINTKHSALGPIDLPSSEFEEL